MDLTTLNAAQREAVLATEGAVLVLAGAGSGKTRVLTMRTAYLIEQGVAPYSILALTFTNKAASEMRERIEALTGNVSGMWVGTFHSICARLLRYDIDKLGYAQNFTIYDESDAVALIKNILTDMKIDPKATPPKSVKYKISRAKNDGVTSARYEGAYPDEPDGDVTAEIFAKYESRMFANNALDFDDLLLKTRKALSVTEIREKYAEKFKYIMVDEYQDTNLVQYEIVKLLSSKHNNVFAVGDDDQSIYGWRGADIRNILEFERDFPNVRTIYLEQNYRSHQAILDTANEVIANNARRKPKRLYSDRIAGVRPCERGLTNEYKEAEFIADECAKLHGEGLPFKSMAVLYRTNVQSRVIEDELKRRGMPYRIYGGLGFYDRKEIKDVIAYLNLVANPKADMSLARIINEPKRGIGGATLERIRVFAVENGVCLYEAAEGCPLDARSRSAVNKFLAVIENLRDEAESRGVAEFIDYALDETGYMRALDLEDTPEAAARIENLGEFIKIAYEFEQIADNPTLESFLERNSLISDIDNIGGDEGISLMTLHSAKGLEFDAVFMAGMEESYMPHSMCGDEGVEEERRLCYVGMTRAKSRLYLTYASMRTLFARERGPSAMPRDKSRFLKEIPPSLVTVIADRPQRTLSHAEKKKPFVSFAEYRRTQGLPGAKDTSGFKEGQRVYHEKFGAGKIVGINGEGKEKIASVDFEKAGLKKMFLAFAPLKAIN